MIRLSDSHQGLPYALYHGPSQCGRKGCRLRIWEPDPHTIAVAHIDGDGYEEVRYFGLVSESLDEMQDAALSWLALLHDVRYDDFDPYEFFVARLQNRALRVLA